MFGKVIELKSRRERVSEGGDLPLEISNQFNLDVLEKGLSLARSSRISHINFGRESYFGLVTDASGKGVNVHIVLDPETKILKRATCGCFRSNTRSYCHHIVSFVRYVLQPDEESGGLRSLEDDYRSSLWHEFSWYGFQHFGDSTLGFKAQFDHGGEGIRIGYFGRDGDEILVLIPGVRLVEEFLHEFFDIIRRDIDPVIFKRMYGRKLKDPKVPSLRRRPWAHGQEETDLHRRGLKTARLHFEESIWHRLAKVGFIIGGRDGGDFRFGFFEHKQQLTVEAYDEDDELIMRFVPPRAHIGTVMEISEANGTINNDLFIHPVPLKTGHRVELTDSSALRITPVVENPDPAGEPKFLDRTELEDRLYGGYYYFPDWGFFHIETSPGRLPADLFAANRSVTVEPENITEFINEFGHIMREEPNIFIEDNLLQRRTVEAYEKARIDHKEFSDEAVGIDVTYGFGDFSISFREIFEARQENKRFLVHGEKWVDTFSPEFSWMDGLDPEIQKDSDRVRMSRAEYLRFLALHDKLEKNFASSRLRNWFEGLENLQPPSRLPSLKRMNGKLREYQKNGYGWLWFLYQNGFSGLLCDDMGLGKTHQVMALMTGIVHKLANRPSEIRFLVVCPTSVLSHWKEKLDNYCPHLDPYIYHGTDRSFAEAFESNRLIITSYGIALRDIEIFAEYQFELVVLDEVQAVKNKSTKTYAAIKALQSVCTIGLTGTPIENSLKDLKSLFDIILPGYLLSDSQFDRNYRVPIEETGDKPTERKLVQMIQPFTLRRKKEQVLKELPPKIEDIRKCELYDDQIRFYRDIVENQGTELVQTLKDPDKRVPYMHVFAVLNYLKQVCNHPCLLANESRDYEKYGSGKWDLFVELLEESLGSGQKVVVFSQYVKMLTLIESFLEDRGIEFATIKGHTRNRAESVRRFNNDADCMVFTASLRASGLGIDLTGGSVVIHYDRWWNSAREEQATDRVHRIGQRRGVQVFKLITEGTLEEKIDLIIGKKRRLMESVVKQDDQALLKHFSREELIELISY